MTLSTFRSTIRLTPDGFYKTLRPIEFEHPLLPNRHQAFVNECRVARVLGQQASFRSFAPLLSVDQQDLTLCFEVAVGAPLGPKYATHLSPAQSDRIEADLADIRRIETPRDLLSYSIEKHVEYHLESGWLSNSVARLIRAIPSPELVFCHGDPIPSNIFADELGTLTFVDWELAGWYPPSYDRAVLWFVLLGAGKARERFVSNTPPDELVSFWLCAVLFAALHCDFASRRPPKSGSQEIFAQAQMEATERLAEALRHHG